MDLPQKNDREIALSLSFAKVIPVVEAVWIVCRKHSKHCTIFAVCAHVTLTDELTCWIC